MLLICTCFVHPLIHRRYNTCMNIHTCTYVGNALYVFQCLKYIIMYILCTVLIGGNSKHSIFIHKAQNHKEFSYHPYPVYGQFEALYLVLICVDVHCIGRQCLE